MQTKDKTTTGGNGQRTALTPQDRRALIPKTGLKEYWYPALQVRKVGKKPVRLRMLDELLVFFRGKNGNIAALTDICPHRGGSLGYGDSHFPGTVSCPYHGWTYDDRGECVAVLSEGPDSLVPGKVRARSYPTEVRKGIVFVWMGEGEPVPIHEDIPEEMVEPDSESMVFMYTTTWPVNWAVALENSLDSHVPYVHRNAFRMAMVGSPRHYGPTGRRPVLVPNGVAVVPTDTKVRPAQEFYPGLGKWPKSQWRRSWNWVFKPALSRARKRPPFNKTAEWGQAHHLPSQFRTMSSTHAYTRVCVPIDAGHTRVIYYYAVRPTNWLAKAYLWAQYHLVFKWHMYVNFSNQDRDPMVPQRYDTPEKLVANDAEIIVWRKLLNNARGIAPTDQAAVATDAEQFAHRYERELGMESSEALESLEHQT